MDGKNNKIKKPNGRPTSYQKKYDKEAYKLCLLGLTDKQMAEFFEVSEVTFNAWKKKFPSFLKSLKEGKLIADAEVTQSLYKKATGQVKIKEVTYERVVNGFDDETGAENVEYKKKVVVKEVAPDTVAQIYWTKNRQPQLWRDKREVSAEVTENTVSLQDIHANSKNISKMLTDGLDT